MDPPKHQATGHDVAFETIVNELASGAIFSRSMRGLAKKLVVSRQSTSLQQP